MQKSRMLRGTNIFIRENLLSCNKVFRLSKLPLFWTHNTAVWDQTVISVSNSLYCWREQTGYHKWSNSIQKNTLIWKHPLVAKVVIRSAIVENSIWATVCFFCHLARICLKGVSHEIFSVLFWHVWIDLGLYKNLWLFLIFSVEPRIFYLSFKFRCG